jgi:hypothetical protein
VYRQCRRWQARSTRGEIEPELASVGHDPRAQFASPAYRTRFQLRGASVSKRHVCCKPELGGTVGMRWTQTRPRAKRRMLAHRSRTRAGLPTRPPLDKTAKPKVIDRIGDPES